MSRGRWERVSWGCHPEVVCFEDLQVLWVPTGVLITLEQVLCRLLCTQVVIIRWDLLPCIIGIALSWDTEVICLLGVLFLRQESVRGKHHGLMCWSLSGSLGPSERLLLDQAPLRLGRHASVDSCDLVQGRSGLLILHVVMNGGGPCCEEAARLHSREW